MGDRPVTGIMITLSAEQEQERYKDAAGSSPFEQPSIAFKNTHADQKFESAPTSAHLSLHRDRAAAPPPCHLHLRLRLPPPLQHATRPTPTLCKATPSHLRTGTSPARRSWPRTATPARRTSPHRASASRRRRAGSRHPRRRPVSRRCGSGAAAGARGTRASGAASRWARSLARRPWGWRWGWGWA